MLRRHRAADSFPPSLPAGAAAEVRSAADATARRLGIEPPLGSLCPAQLRTLAHELEREHLVLGGVPALSLPNGLRFHGNHSASRRLLELQIAALRKANARLRAGRGSARRKAAA